jgi:O-antigen ligase
MDGFALFATRPLAGVGAGAFANARAEAFGVYLNPHSLYVQIIAELGLFGLIVYFIFYRDIFRICLRNIWDIRNSSLEASELTALSQGIIVAAISLLITGFFAHSAFRYTWYFLAGITAASQHIIYNLKSSVRNTGNDLIPIREQTPEKM